MKRLARRFGLIVLCLVLLFVILRAIVVPLARQRQERRNLDPNLFSLLPASVDQWVLRRGFLREVDARLWPESATLFELRLNQMGLPTDRIKSELGIGRIHGGEWLGGRDKEGRWIFLGSLARLRAGQEFLRTLSEAPDTLLALEEGVLGRKGEVFMLASAPELLRASSWLAALPEWLELTDLLIGSDWLEFRRCGEGGALLGAKAMLEVVICEGLAWNCSDAFEVLAPLAPGPAALIPVSSAPLDSLPGLRRSIASSSWNANPGSYSPLPCSGS